MSDYYLRIETVPGTAEDAVLTGQSVAYTDLFANASIHVRRNAFVSRKTSTRQLGLSSHVMSVSFPIWEALKGILKLSIAGVYHNLGCFDSYDANWDDQGLDIQLTWIEESELDVNVTTAIQANLLVKPRNKVWELLSQLIYGPPAINFFNDYTKQGGKLGNSFGVGGYTDRKFE